MVAIAEKQVPQRPSLLEKYTAGEVEDYVNRMTRFLREEGNFTNDEITSFIFTERAGLEGAGFNDEEIGTFTATRLGQIYDPVEAPEPRPARPYSTPEEFWKLAPEDRERIRQNGWLSQYFTEEELPYSNEQGVIAAPPEPSKIPGSQIIEDIRLAITAPVVDPIQKADAILHAFDPILDPVAYQMYKFINGKLLHPADILWAGVRRADPTLSKEKDFEKAMLQVLEYNPSGFMKGVGDVSEFIASLSTAKHFVKFPAAAAPVSEVAKARALQWGVAQTGRGIAKGIEEAENPLDVPFYVGPEIAKGYGAGLLWTYLPSYVGKAGRWVGERKSIQFAKKQWQKVIDIPISKVREMSDTGLAGRFRDAAGERLVSFYKRAGTYRAKWMSTRGEIKLRAAEADQLVRKFDDITKGLEEWSKKPESFKQVSKVLRGEAKVETLPEQLHGWVTEAMQARREASVELADYWRKRGNERLARGIEKNADKYLPRAFRAHETTDGLWSWLRRPRYGGGEFRMRKDKWTLWEGKKGIGKHDTLAETEEHLRNKATKAVQARIDKLSKTIRLLREDIKKAPKVEKQIELSGLLKQRKSLSSKKSRTLQSLEKKLTGLRKTFTEPPEELPAPKEATINIAGTKLTIKPPLSVEKLEALGMITDPRYLLAKAMTQGKVDIENAKLLDYIGKKWGQDAPSGYRINDLKEWARDLGLRRVPDVEKYAGAKGKYLPKGMAEDLRLLIERPRGLAMRLYDAYLGVWKESKIVWNPATHGRNITGNLIFSDFAGTTPLNPGNFEYYQKGFKALLNKNQSYKNMLKYNAIGTEYYGTEIKPIALRVTTGGDKKLFESILGGIATVRAKVGTLYAMEDQIYKAAAYEKYIAQGMSPRKACDLINQWFPNYEMLSPLTQAARRSPLGAPFLAFTDQAMKIAGRAFKEHPVKLMKWAALPGAMTEFTTWYLGMTPAEREVVDTNRNYFEPLIPHRDDQGRVITWDLKWTIPLANDLLPDAKRYGIDVPWALSGPAMDAAVQMISGRDPFTGDAVSDEDASLGRRILDTAVATAKTVAPVPSIVQFGPKRLLKAGKGEGRESLERAIAGVLVGLNLRAPYIVRQKLYTDIREDMMSAEPDRYIMALEKIIVFNESYKSPNQPRITVDGLNRSIMYHLRKDIIKLMEEE